MKSLERAVSFTLLFLAAVFAASEVLAVMTLAPLPHGRSFAIATFALAAVFPDAALCLMLFSLPLFGNKPATIQFSFFLLFQATTFLGLSLRGILRRSDSESNKLERPALWTAVLAYAAASVLGLVALPLGNFLHEIQARFPNADLKVFAANVLSFGALTEDKQAYAFLSCLLTLLAIGIGGWAMRRAESRPRLLLIFGCAILLGLLTSLLAGILDYYRVIDLTKLRGLDPIINPGNAQFRLQSFFGHSGWFAEYVTLTVPFSLLILLERLPFWIRVLQCLAILLLGEYVLILTYQRGGWVSYPLTLFAMWAAIYVVRRLESGEKDVLTALRRSFVKVCISLPITVLLSLAFITFGMRSDSGVQASLQSYVSRFEDIGKTSDRTDFMRAGYRIGKLHPFLGAGSESFGYQFHKEFERESGHHSGELVLPLHGTAHTLYFQIFSGKGIGGLLLLMLVVAYAFVPALRIVARDENASLEKKVFLSAIACFACSFLIYGVVQEIFYIQCLQVLFFIVIALAAASMQKVRFSQREEKLLWGFVTLMFAAHLIWEKKVYASMNSDRGESRGLYGCYDEERAADGRAFRWCLPRARALLPLKRDELGEYVEARIGFDFLSAGLSSAVVEAASDQGEATVAQIPPLQEKTLRIAVSSSASRILTSAGTLIAVDIRSNSFFIPRFVFERGHDYRMLSFRLYPEIR